MMSRKIKLPLKAMSINKAWQGKNYKTKHYKRYEQEVIHRIKRKETIKGLVEIKYGFGLVHFKKTDLGNLEKALTDILVKAEVIEDDRFVKRFIMEKFQTDKDYIFIKINKINN